MEPLDSEEGFRPVSRQTARTYVYTEESEAGPGIVVVTDPVAVRPTEEGQDVIHRESDGTLSIVRLPWGFLDMHIAEEREFSKDDLKESWETQRTTVTQEETTDAVSDTYVDSSKQDARDVMENGSDTATEPAKYMPCMNDAQGEVSVGNECMYYPDCGCQRPKDQTYGDGAEGPPPNLDV